MASGRGGEAARLLGSAAISHVPDLGVLPIVVNPESCPDCFDDERFAASGRSMAP